MLKFVSISLLLLSVVTTGQLSAHQKKESITRIIFNQRNANIEIMHRFSLHDAEHSAKQLFGKTMDILGDTFAQKHFADYVNDSFTIKRLSGETLPLTLVGFEIEGRHLWIYQETPMQDAIKGLSITHGALRDIWPEQVNLVNIERNKKVRSLVFKGAVGELQVVFGDGS